jgi:hypothetical protein
MDPEAGRLTNYGVNDEGTTGFTCFGSENLKDLLPHRPLRQTDLIRRGQ